MSLSLRDALPADDDAIRAVHVAAFATHPFSAHDEQRIVDRLRARGRLSLSLVGCDAQGAVVAHAAFSPVRVAGRDCGWFGLGPLGVLPSQQGLGLGSRLVRLGLERLRARGAAGCVVLGEPAYYGRFGFAPCAGLRLPGPPPSHFMALALDARPLPAGEVAYDEAFAAGA